MEGIQVIEKSIPCAKRQNQLLKSQAASKQIKNAINPLMLDQKSPPRFQAHDARCRSGIIGNLCYYKCASFALLCCHRALRVPAAEQIHTGVSQIITARISGNVGEAGQDQEVQTLLWDQTGAGVTAKESGFPNSPGRSINPPGAKPRLLLQRSEGVTLTDI